MVTILIVSLFVSMGLFLKVFRKHFDLIFRNISELVDKQPQTSRRMILLKASLIEAINYHNRAKA